MIYGPHTIYNINNKFVANIYLLSKNYIKIAYWPQIGKNIQIT